MAFTVDDFQDLLHLLEAHPEWRAELRRHVLSDEVLELPALMRQLTERIEALAEAQARTERRVEELAEAQARTDQQLVTLTERVERLAEAQARTEQRLEELAQRTAFLTGSIDELVGRVHRLTGRVDGLAGEAAELRYTRHAHAYFSRLARRIRVLDSQSLADILDTAVEAGRLTEDERDDAILADLVFTGRQREDQSEAYFAVEISVAIDEHDVERAVRRAALLERLGVSGRAVVAGGSIDARAAVLARERKVWQVLDGAAHAPVIW